MNGPKRPVLAKSQKPNAQSSKPAKATKSSLSAEFVEDSDDHNDQESSVLPKKVAHDTSSKKAAPRPIAAKAKSAEREPVKKPKDASPVPIRAVGNGNRTVKDSQDYATSEEDSDSNAPSRSSSPSPVKKTISAPAPNAQAKPLKGPSSNGIASNGSKPSDTHSQNHVVAKQLRKEGSGSDSSDSSASGEDDDSQDESSSSEQTSLQSNKKSNPSQNPAPPPETLPYEPPQGFEPASKSSHPSSEIFEVLAASNLAGKQIWHITVPESVPITTIQEISSQSIGNGRLVVSYKGADYGLVEERGAEASNRALLLPSARSNDFQPSKIPILKTLHLQQLINIPSCANWPADVTDPSSKPRTHVKVVRQQPQGLKMRYHAFGASDSSDSDVSMTNATKTPELCVPNIPVPSTKKRKASDGFANSTELSPTKPKKHKARHESPMKTGELKGDADSPLIGKQTEASQSSVASPAKITAKAVDGDQRSREKKRRKDEKQQKDHVAPVMPQSILPTDLTKEAETIVPEEVVNNDAAINIIPSGEDAKIVKARRKDERRKRKEMQKGSPTQDAEEPLPKGDEAIQQEPGNPSGEHSAPLSMLGRDPKKQISKTARTSPTVLQNPTSETAHKETKEEKAKRREEKKQRTVASDFY